MALTTSATKAIYLEEMANEFGADHIDSETAEKFANVFASAVNRTLLELLEINAGSFTTSAGAVTGQGETA